MRRETKKKMWARILRPSCFGNWDCLAVPNKDNHYDPRRDGSMFRDGKPDGCPVWDECKSKRKIEAK